MSESHNVHVMHNFSSSSLPARETQRISPTLQGRRRTDAPPPLQSGRRGLANDLGFGREQRLGPLGPGRSLASHRETGEGRDTRGLWGERGNERVRGVESRRVAAERRPAYGPYTYSVARVRISSPTCRAVPHRLVG